MKPIVSVCALAVRLMPASNIVVAIRKIDFFISAIANCLCLAVGFGRLVR